MKSVALLALCAGVLTSAALHAQPTPGTLEVSPFAGYLFGGTVVTSPGHAANHITIADRGTFGLNLGIALSSHWTPELHWSHTQTNQQQENGFFFARTTIDTVLVGASYRLLGDRWQPYVGAGLGIARFSAIGLPEPFATRLESPAHTAFTGSIAAGLKSYLTRHLGVRVEAKGYASKLPSRPIPANGCVVTSDGLIPLCQKSWLLDLDVTGGVIARF